MPLSLVAAAGASSETLQLIEIGAVLLALGIIAFATTQFKISPVPFFLLAGLMCGEGGLLPLALSERFLSIGAQIGALLLLLLLGLEYSVREIGGALRRNRITGLVDVLNAVPGILVALVLGWGWPGALALGGIAYVSSSGIAAQLIRETGWQRSELAKRTVSVLVIEDLALAPYLPLVTAVGAGLSYVTGLVSVSVAIVITGAVLLLGARGESFLTRILNARESNALLLTVFGLALLVGGLASLAGFSGAVAAFLVGLLLTGDVAQAVRTRLSPLRDLFAALFFVFFGLNTDPADLLPMAPAILVLVVTGVGLKLVTGWWAGRTLSDRRSWLRISSYLVARGEFSIVIAGLMATQSFGADLKALTVGYVIVTAFAGSFMLKFQRNPLEKLENA